MNPWEVKGDADGRIDYEKLQKKVCRACSMEILLCGEEMLPVRRFLHGVRPPLKFRTDMQFGCSRLTQDLVARVEKLTGRPAHPLLRRGIFYAHRDLEELLNAYEKGEPFYLYTGRVRAFAVLHSARSDC